MKTNRLQPDPAFERVYKRLEGSSAPLLILGKAGTGKSTLLTYLRDFSSENIVILAPTGVAAVNVGGQTIHSFFRFRPDVTPDAVKEIRMRRSQRQLYRQMDILIIDEISMVRADLLDCVDAFLRLHGPQPGEPFGGVRLVMAGDLYQLPPVVTARDKELFTDVYTGPYFFCARAFQQIQPEVVELETVYRQRDQEFIALLNAVRDNSVSDRQLAGLNQRCVRPFAPRPDEMFVHLTTVNAAADRINQHQLDELTGSVHSLEGRLEGKFDAAGLPTLLTLKLKRGAQVMLLNNDPAGRWFNGTLGKVLSIEPGSDGDDVVCVQLEDESLVQVTPFTWEAFRYVYDEKAEKVETETVGVFTQYPLRLAWAVTIHKAQGKTFPRAVIDIGRGAFSHGQTYVALSRCSTIDGLVLKRPIRRRDIILDERIVRFLDDRKPEQTGV